MPRREYIEVLGDIVRAVDHLARDPDRSVLPTHVARRANVPYDRLQDYLEELHELGLVAEPEDQPGPALTPKGQAFLDDYRSWLEAQKQYGFDPRALEDVD